jgi:hypothetical protein
MHDMSNTRKEIAARLGFAAGNGAKTAFANNDPALANFLVKYKENENNNYHSENVVLLAEFVGSSSEIAHAKDILRKVRAAGHLPSDLNDEQYSLYKNLAAKLKSKYPGAKFARSGAKAQFDNKQIAQGLSRLLKETGFDGMASDVLSGPSDSETLRKYVRVLKGKMSPLSGDAKSAELLSKLEKMLSARASAKTTMTREQTEEQKAGLKLMSAASPAVGAKIAKLIKEGKPQDQAVAIALDMKRRGEL